MEIKIGNFYDGKVLRLMAFGAIVLVSSEKEGLLHISQITNQRVNDISDYLKVGQVVKVKVLDIDGKGRLRLTMKD